MSFHSFSSCYLKGEWLRAFGFQAKAKTRRQLLEAMAIWAGCMRLKCCVRGMRRPLFPGRITTDRSTTISAASRQVQLLSKGRLLKCGPAEVLSVYTTFPRPFFSRDNFRSCVQADEAAQSCCMLACAHLAGAAGLAGTSGTTGREGF